MSVGLKRVSGAGSIRIKEIEMTERQKTKEFDFNGFFNASLDRLTEIMSDLKETAQAEDIESLKGKVKILKELSDAFGKIDQNKLSRDEQKACKHFVRALDRLSGLYKHILDIAEKGEGSSREGLKMMFVLVKDLSLTARDLNLAKKHAVYEDVADFER